MSVVAMCTSSWFIVEYSRSLLGLVSNALDDGSMSMRSVLKGSGVADAFP
jgi:hypothetical protein